MSPYINVQTEVSKTIHTQDNASEVDLTIDSRALHKFLDITNSERVIEVDVTTISGLAEREQEEVKSNKVEKAEERASKYVYRQKSNSPTAMEEQVKSDMALATNVVNEIAKNISIISSYHCRCGKWNIL